MTQTQFSSPRPLFWHPTHQHAEDRLNQFLPMAGTDYARRRNFDLGPNDRSNVSCLSPWNRHRLLLEEDILRTTLSQYSLTETEKFVQEVLWRGYFKGWLEHNPEVWRRYQRNLITLCDRLETDAALHHRYASAVIGNTGIACFDAWMQELATTGYLHNHARMWVASIWIFTLELPWELGADYFHRHLLDGDPAANTCSWRWVAGLHTAGKTYLARASNIDQFTEGRFSPRNQLAEHTTPITESALPPPSPPYFESAQIPGQRYGLLITEEDCSPHRLPLPHPPASLLALSTPTPRSALPVAEHVTNFSQGAVRAAAGQAELAFQIPCPTDEEASWSDTLAEWIRRDNLDCILTARLPIGPIQARLHKAVQGLPVPFIEHTRAYDAAVWPYAGKGFFALKKKIPTIFGTLGL